MRKQTKPKSKARPSLKDWELKADWDWDEQADEMRNAICAAVEAAVEECRTRVGNMARKSAEEALAYALNETVFVDLVPSEVGIRLTMEIELPDAQGKFPRFEVDVFDAIANAIDLSGDKEALDKLAGKLEELAKAARESNG